MPDVVTAPGAQLGEGPLWDAATQRLLWVDIVGESVHELDPVDGSQRSWLVGGLVGALALAADGRLVLGIDGRVATLDRATGLVSPVADLHDDPDIRANDCGVDPEGRLVIGTMSVSGAERAAGLYRVGSDARVTQLLSAVTISNGLDWDLDGALLYHVDTPTRRVRAYAYDPDGPLVPAGRELDLSAIPGVPDGMTIDADGNLWIAFWDGYAVRCFDPHGRELERLPLPAGYVTSCGFGGEALDELYVTTARWDRLAGDQPLAGAVFRFRPGAVGRPSSVWTGVPDA